MKRKTFILWCLVCAAALALVFQQTRVKDTLGGPPSLEIRCAGHTEASSFWYAGWDSPNLKFVADGDPPYSPYGRDNFPLFQAAPGDTVFLSFSIAPQEVHVSMHYDVPTEAWSSDLYDGSGDQLAITLPENCGGAYTISAKWAYGGASYGFIIEDVSADSLNVVEDVPTLTLSWNGDQTPAWHGSRTWRVPDGPGSFTESDTASSGPLISKEDLPVIPVVPGENIQLEFSDQPHEVVVWAIPGRYADDPGNATSEQVFLGENNMLTIPVNGTDVIYEVFANWNFSLLNGGRSFYGFYVP